MSLLFCGDLTVPYDVLPDIEGIIELFNGNIAIANLEGAIVPMDKLGQYKWKDKYSLYSSPAVLDVIKKTNIQVVSLCNNHILDYNYSINNTENILDENGIKYFGLKNHDILKLKSKLKGKVVYIITFATYANEHSLNLFNPSKVIRDIKKLKALNGLVIIYPHWGIEKFCYPEPADRKFAHRCIDAGADLIVGHHPHIIQPIEKYKEKWIVYSIGNFILPQTYYPDKKLVFKDQYILKELIVEWDGENIKVHPLLYNKDKNQLTKDISFDLKSLYSLFENNTFSNFNYLLFYLSKTSLLNMLVRTRYFDTLEGEYLCYLVR